MESLESNIFTVKSTCGPITASTGIADYDKVTPPSAPAGTFDKVLDIPTGKSQISIF